MNRRKFIRQASQMTIAAGIASMVSYLIFRDKPDEECNLDFACQNCSKAKGCQLPQAKNNNLKK